MTVSLQLVSFPLDRHKQNQLILEVRKMSTWSLLGSISVMSSFHTQLTLFDWNVRNSQECRWGFCWQHCVGVCVCCVYSDVIAAEIWLVSVSVLKWCASTELPDEVPAIFSLIKIGSDTFFSKLIFLNFLFTLAPPSVGCHPSPLSVVAFDGSSWKPLPDSELYISHFWGPTCLWPSCENFSSTSKT